MFKCKLSAVCVHLKEAFLNEFLVYHVVNISSMLCF